MNHVDEIVELLFEYIGLIKHEGIQEWIHNECHDLSMISFKFKVCNIKFVKLIILKLKKIFFFKSG